MTPCQIITAAMSRRRLLAWWVLLNAHRRPADVPKDVDDAELFRHLGQMLPLRERLDMWNRDRYALLHS
jgi:hypothetical protein